MKEKKHGCLTTIAVGALICIALYAIGTNNSDQTEQSTSETETETISQITAEQPSTPEPTVESAPVVPTVSEPETEPMSEPETEPMSEPVAVVVTYPEGQYKVGTDMPAGAYMLLQNNSNWPAYFCYSTDANSRDIVKNDNFDGNSIIEVYDGEYLTINRCYAVALSDAPDLTPTDGYLTDGFYIVGTHIEPGEYKVEATESFPAYVCIYSDLRHSIVTNDNFENTRYIELTDGQYVEIKRGRILVGD